MLSQTNEKLSDEEIREVFYKYDADNDWHLDINEFRKFMLESSLPEEEQQNPRKDKFIVPESNRKLLGDQAYEGKAISKSKLVEGNAEGSTPI